MTQTNVSMPMQYNPWTGEQASAGTQLENANGDEHIYTRPLLFKVDYYTLSNGYISIQGITQMVFLIPIHWIVIYLVDGVFQDLNNRDQ